VSLLSDLAGALTAPLTVFCAEIRKLFSHKLISLFAKVMRMSVALRAGPEITMVRLQSRTKLFRPLKSIRRTIVLQERQQFKLENILEENSARTRQMDSLVRPSFIGNSNHCRPSSRPKSGAHLFARRHSRPDTKFPWLRRYCADFRGSQLWN
jgi:hypothetical protein